MEFIEDSVRVRVRFSESDAMGVVWHGNYLKFFEDAREALGVKFNMSYTDIYNNGFVVPIVDVKVKYKSSVKFGEEVEVRIKLIKTPAAKIIHHYEVWNVAKNQLSCEGSTVQVFLHEKSRDLELFTPTFFKEWLNQLNWKEA